MTGEDCVRCLWPALCARNLLIDVAAEDEWFGDAPEGLLRAAGTADGDGAVVENAAQHRLIVPVQCEYYALEGLAQLLETVELVRARINPQLQLSGLLLTMHDGRTRLAQDVASEVRQHFGSKVFDAVIPRSVRLAEAPSHGRPISQFDPRSPGADAYYRLALEVVERG